MITRILPYPAPAPNEELADVPSELLETGCFWPADGAPGHRLLPRWHDLVRALPRLGAVCTISRNQHVVLGGLCVYPDIDKGDGCNPDALQFHHDFPNWNQGWFYREMVNGQLMTGIEFRDSGGMGFHKVVFTDESDLDLARTLVHAFEQEPLTQEEVAGAFKANHLDGACCARCEANLNQAARARTVELQEFISTAIREERHLRVVLAHPALVSVRRFIPRRWKPNGMWQSIAGDGVTLFLRHSGIGSVEFSDVEPPDLGPCRLATLNDPHGSLLASIILEP